MDSSINIGSVIDRVFGIYRDQFSVLMPVSAVVFVVAGVLSDVLTAAAPGLFALAFLIDLVANALFTGMVVGLVADIQDGRRDASVGQLLRSVSPVLGKLILTGLVAAIGEGIGFILLVVPGLILVTIWAVFAPVVVLERPDGLGALGRSRELVRGNGWQVFAVVFFMFVLVGVLGGGLTVAAGLIGSGVGLVVRLIVSVLISPLASLAAAVLYFELGGVAAREMPADTYPSATSPGPFPPATA